MKNKWKRIKNKIFVLMLSVVCLVGLFPSFDSEAANRLGFFTPNVSKVFPPVLGNLDGTHNVTQTYESDVYTGGIDLQVGKKYLLYGYAPNILNIDFKYDDDRNNLVESRFYLKAGGQQFQLNDNYIMCIVDGYNWSGLTLCVDVLYSINPYVMGDGYIYQNECQVSWSCTGDIIIYELDQSDLEYYQQFQLIHQSLGNMATNDSYILEKLHSIMLSADSLKTTVSLMYELLLDSQEDKVVMDNFQQNSSSQSSQLGQLNQENKVDKIDINNASTTVDSNIDLNAVGSSGVVLSSLTGHQKILTMLLGVTAISLIAYVFFGKR